VQVHYTKIESSNLFKKIRKIGNIVMIWYNGHIGLSLWPMGRLLNPSAKEIQIINCPCRRAHVFVSDRHVYACKCDEEKLRYYRPWLRYGPSIHRDFILRNFMTKKTRIKHSIIEYAKLLKEQQQLGVGS
jgi:hypothetical protein